MRIIASVLALVLVGLVAPAASACRTGPALIQVAVWEHAPAPDQVRPGEVVLEVAFPANAWLVEPSPPDQIVFTTCNPDQQTLFQIVRVLAGDAHGDAFVIVPGWAIVMPVTIDPATGKQFGSAEAQRWFVVGTLNAQSKYVVEVDDSAGAGKASAKPGENVDAGLTRRPLLALNPRWPS